MIVAGVLVLAKMLTIVCLMGSPKPSGMIHLLIAGADDDDAKDALRFFCADDASS